VAAGAHSGEAKSPLIGFGDPVFNAEEESKPSSEERTVRDKVVYRFLQGLGHRPQRSEPSASPRDELAPFPLMEMHPRRAVCGRSSPMTQ
jgi:hypothetical protein